MITPDRMKSMNSLTLLALANNQLSDDLRFFQIDMQELLTTLRAEGGAAISSANFHRHGEVAYDLLETSVVTWAGKKGVLMDGRYTTGQLAKYYIPRDELNDMIQDAVAKIDTLVGQLFQKTELEYKFVIRILPNAHLLIGIDPRDLETQTVDEFVDTPEEFIRGEWL